MPELHKRYGGSTARRTLNCPGWARLKDKLGDKLPKPRESDAAKRGTRLHDLMEKAYKNNVSVLTLPQYPQQPLQDQEALMDAQAMAETVLDKYDIDELLIEEMVLAEGFEDIVGGSADLMGISADGKTLVLPDYKFGYKPVKHTEQFELYGGCALDTHPKLTKDVETIVAVVIQPAESSEPLEFTFSRQDIIASTNRFLDVVDAAECGDHDDQQYPGDWCTYCPCERLCPAKRQQVGEFLAYDPEVPAELAQGLALADQMDAHAKALREAAHSALEQGIPVQGFKLVAKRATRSWVDPDKVLESLKKRRDVKRSQYMKEQLHTVAQVEKLFGKGKMPDDIAGEITSVSSGTKVVPESDKGTAIVKEAGGGKALGAMLNKTD